VKTNSVQLVIETAMVIRHRREALHLSQYELAGLCGLHKTYVGAVERGQQRLHIKSLGQIAAMLGAPPSKLLEMAEHQPSANIDYAAANNFDYFRKPIDPEKLVVAVACVLQEQREMQGISEVRLAEISGLNQRYISIYANTGYDLSLDSLNRLAMALAIRTSKVLRLAERSLNNKKTMEKIPKSFASEAEEMVTAVMRAVSDERKCQSMTQKKLSERSGFTQPYVSDLENHWHNISMKQLFKLASALEVPASRLLARAEREINKREIAKKSTRQKKK
jgi:transcriptional regulator with XRE-family HTH domain